MHREPEASSIRADRALVSRVWWRRVLLHSWPGRLLGLGVFLRLLVAIVGAVWGSDSGLLALFRLIATIALIAGSGVLCVRLIAWAKRALLWRVRPKLILSYIFIGFVPALLIVAFFMLCGLLVFFNFSS